MLQSDSKKFSKLHKLALLALIFPVLLVVMAFMAAKSDAETQREYYRIRQEQATKAEVQKQQSQEQTQLATNQSQN